MNNTPKTQHDSETPANGQQVISVVGFFYRFIDGVPEVLLAKRAATKKFLPKKYEMPGGHVDFGEELEVALKREVKEELNVDCAVEDTFYAFTYLNAIKKSHTVEIVYFATITSPHQSITIQPEDHSEIRWCSYDNLLELKDDICVDFNNDGSIDSVHYADPEWLALLKGFEILGQSQPTAI